MLFSLLYLILRRVLGTGRRPQDERDIELLVLRHQVKVLQRQVKRLSFTGWTGSCWPRRAGAFREAPGPRS